MRMLKPEIWTKDDGTRYAMLPLADFEELEDAVEDAGLSRIFRKAKKRDAKAPRYTHAEVKRRLLGSKKRQAKSATTSHGEMKRLLGIPNGKKRKAR